MHEGCVELFLTIAIDHLLFAISDLEISVFVDPSQVTRPKPVVTQGGRIRFWVADIACVRHSLPAAHGLHDRSARSAQRN